MTETEDSHLDRTFDRQVAYLSERSSVVGIE